ncbi:hypothetical protein BDN67DRAFT_1006231 [Paxillus ammoniavirescens]|nr:hypothetical protein BDN67DRAFT_1006231 [Paxillus ammoniavirescens]
MEIWHFKTKPSWPVAYVPIQSLIHHTDINIDARWEGDGTGASGAGGTDTGDGSAEPLKPSTPEPPWPKSFSSAVSSGWLSTPKFSSSLATLSPSAVQHRRHYTGFGNFNCVLTQDGHLRKSDRGLYQPKKPPPSSPPMTVARYGKFGFAVVLEQLGAKSHRAFLVSKKNLPFGGCDVTASSYEYKNLQRGATPLFVHWLSVRFYDNEERVGTVDPLSTDTEEIREAVFELLPVMNEIKVWVVGKRLNKLDGLDKGPKGTVTWNAVDLPQVRREETTRY